MAKDTVRLTLQGEVIPLDLYAKAVGHFSALVQTLSEEVVGPNEIKWDVTRLDTGSAILEARATQGDPKKIAIAVDAYKDLTQAAEQGRTLPFSESVTGNLRGVISVLNGKVSAAVFGTDDYAVTIDKPINEVNDENVGEEVKDKEYTLGVLTGIIAALWASPLKVGLRETLFGNIVYCFPNESQQETVREYWGKRVSISGLIARNKATGQPLFVRNIRSIDLAPSMPPGSYREARGAAPWQEGDESSEAIIRRIRDAS